MEWEGKSQVYNLSLKSLSNNANRFVVKEPMLEKILDKNNVRIANTRKGYWRLAHSPVLKKTLTNDYIKSKNYIFFSDY